MRQTITKEDFRDAFFRTGRKDQFSYEALGALYDHLEELDENYDLDVIALCCEYAEESIEEACKNHNVESVDELECVVWEDGTDVLYAQY